MPYYRIASVVLLITGLSHLVGHTLLVPQFQLIPNFSAQIPANDTEQQLLSLIHVYHKKIGGSPVSLMDIQNGLSLCYSLFFLWLAILNLLLYKPIRRNHRLLARISLINSIMLGIGAVIGVFYFFWLPVASFSLAGMLYVMATIIFSRSRQF